MNAPAQGSVEWLAERAGCATASRFKDVLAKIKTGEAADRRKYRVQIVTERLTGAPVETYTNTAMQHGTDTEPFARMAYEGRTGAFVDEVGFLKHPELVWCGGSPDGLIGDDGIIEIKCPYTSTVHVDTLQSGMPSEHKAQCQGLLWITGRQWVDFVSFDPRMPEHLRVYVQRIARDEKYIETLAAEVCNFLGEVDALYLKLMGPHAMGDANHVCTQA
jgi:hypothetical protein